MEKGAKESDRKRATLVRFTVEFIQLIKTYQNIQIELPKTPLIIPQSKLKDPAKATEMSAVFI